MRRGTTQGQSPSDHTHSNWVTDLRTCKTSVKVVPHGSWASSTISIRLASHPGRNALFKQYFELWVMYYWIHQTHFHKRRNKIASKNVREETKAFTTNSKLLKGTNPVAKIEPVLRSRTDGERGPFTEPFPLLLLLQKESAMHGTTRRKMQHPENWQS